MTGLASLRYLLDISSPCGSRSMLPGAATSAGIRLPHGGCLLCVSIASGSTSSLPGTAYATSASLAAVRCLICASNSGESRRALLAVAGMRGGSFGPHSHLLPFTADCLHLSELS